VAQSRRPSLTDEQTQQLKIVFDSFDKDGSGAVSTAEMFVICSDLDLGLTTEELERLIAKTDADGSGEIEFDEFVAALKSHLLGDGGAAGGLGAVFARQTGSMFGDLADLWSNFATPFKGALDAVVSTPLKLFTPDVQTSKPPPIEEEAPPPEPAAIVDESRAPVYGAWDLSSMPPRKAATPKRSENAGYSPPKSLTVGVPSGKFASGTHARKFFTACGAGNYGGR